jgi:hypothetical protein
MRILILITASLMPVSGASALPQGKYGHLRSWEGKYPTYNKSARKFFKLPEINRPLRRLLNRQDYYLLTGGHTKEMPISLIGDYLKVRVCGSPGSYACDNHAILILNLHDGSVFVAFNVIGGQPRYFSTRGKFTDLPQDVQSWFEPRAGT